MTDPLPIVSLIKHSNPAHQERIQRSMRKIKISEGKLVGSPLRGNAHFQWSLPHGQRQSGLLRAVQIKIGKITDGVESAKLLTVLRDAFLNFENPEIQQPGQEMLRDYYLALGAAAGSEGKTLKIRPPTPFGPGSIHTHDLSSPRRQEIPIPEDFPQPSFSWMIVDITIVSRSILRCSIEPLYKLVEFDEIDTFTAMGALNNLASPYPSRDEG